MEQVTVKINLPTLHSSKGAVLSCTGDEVTLELPASFKTPRFNVDDLVHAARTVQARRDLLTGAGCPGPGQDEEPDPDDEFLRQAKG